MSANRKYRDRSGGSMDTPDFLGYGNALNPMHAGFPFEKRIDPRPPDFYGREVALKYLHLPPLSLCIPHVHPRQVRREEGRLVATSAGSEFHHNRNRLIRISPALRRENRFHLAKQGFLLG